jgi:hypothetical protein
VKKTRIALALALVATLAMVSVAVAGPTTTPYAYVPGDSAANVAPNSDGRLYMEGNPRCDDQPFALKIEDYELGVGTYGPIDITYYDGKYVSWAINGDFLDTYDADTVIVKGGPNAMAYFYGANDPDPIYDSDTRLTAPYNSNGQGGKYYGISHIQFCFDWKYTPPAS